MLHRHRYNRYLFSIIEDSAHTSTEPALREPGDFIRQLTDNVRLKIRYLGFLIRTVNDEEASRHYERLKQELSRLYGIRNDFAHTTLRHWPHLEIVLVGHEIGRKATQEMWSKDHPTGEARVAEVRSHKERRLMHSRIRNEIHYSFADAEAAVADMASVQDDLCKLINNLSWEGSVLAHVNSPGYLSRQSKNSALDGQSSTGN